MKKAYVFLADGFEEIEGLTVVDVLRRAGAEVEMVSVMDRKEITGAHGIKVEADRMIEEAGEADLYVHTDPLLLLPRSSGLPLP